MSDIQFVDGMSISRPEKAPEHVVAKVWFRKAEMIKWLTHQPEDSVNVEIKKSKAGKYYAALDNWKPSEKPKAPPQKMEKRTDPNDLIPF